jgi:putative transposase
MQGICSRRFWQSWTLNGSMDGDAYKVFIEQLLLPQLWVGASGGEG